MPAVETIVRGLVVWLLIMLLETVQGGLREALASPQVAFAMRQAAVVLAVLVVFVVTWVTAPWMRLRTRADAQTVGALWVVLTLVFEFALGRILGLSWERLLADYDLPHGGLMPVGLLAMALTPWLVLRLRKAEQRRQ